MLITTGCALSIGRHMDDSLKLSMASWSEALHLSTMWRFDKARQYCIDQINKNCRNQDLVQRVRLALMCDVDEWLVPAYMRLCVRPEPITAREMNLLGPDRVAALCAIRELIRSKTLCRGPLGGGLSMLGNLVPCTGGCKSFPCINLRPLEPSKMIEQARDLVESAEVLMSDRQKECRRASKK